MIKSLAIQNCGKFDDLVLSEFRQRLVEAQAAQTLLNTMLQGFQTRGFSKREETDASTPRMCERVCEP